MTYISRDAGLAYTRHAIAVGLGTTLDESATIATKRWGASNEASIITRAAVGGTGTGGDTIDYDASADSFLELVRPQSILGKLRGLRQVPQRVPFAGSLDGAVAYWTAEGRSTPVSRHTFARHVLEPLKATALIVLSAEMLESAQAEQVVMRDLSKAAAQLTDLTFIDPTNAGIPGQMPAAVTNGATAIAATASFADDIRDAIAAFQGDLNTASWVMHPKLAAKLGLAAAGSGVAANLGARGGDLAGLPVIAAASCPAAVIALIDAASIAFVDEGIEIRRSKDGMIEMDDAPLGDSTTPTASSVVPVSLFATDSVGLIITRRVNWLVGRPDGVVVIAGAAY